MKRLLDRLHHRHATLRSGRRFLLANSGQQLVEFAIAGSLFFTVFAGTMLFAVTIWQYNSVANLAQEGARYASVCGKLSGQNCDVTAFLQTRAPGVVPSMVRVGTPNALAGIQGLLNGLLSGCNGGSGSGSAPAPVNTCNNSGSSGMNPGEEVCVQVQKSTGVLLPLTLQATAHMRIAR